MNRKQRRAGQKAAAGMPPRGSGPSQRQHDADRLNDQALQSHAQGDTVGAIALLRRAIVLNPDRAMYHNNLGELLRLTGETDLALTSFGQAIALNPEYAEAHNNLGNLLRQLRRPGEAAERYRKALALKPNYAEAMNNLGAALIDSQEYGAAADLLRRAIALHPGIAMFHRNLGSALVGQEDFAGARAAFAEALRLAPGMAEAMIPYGDLVRQEGDLDGALAWYKRAWQAEPRNWFAHLRYGVCLMIKGEYRAAWPHFGARWELEEMGADRRPFTQPLWRGEPIAAGRKLLLLTEQGVGETLALCSLLPELLACGVNPVIECDPRLIPMLKRSFPGVEVLARENPPQPRFSQPDLTVQATLFDLVAMFRSSPADCKGALPLKADMDRAASLRARYQSGSRTPLVGVAWHSTNKWLGSPKSAQLTELVPLLSLPGVRFVDLQYGNRAADRAALKGACGVDILHDPEIDQLKDLDAFAAQVAAMDLVISTSNTTAHMAAALGRPTWVLLHKGISPHWYWGLAGETTPWYPTMRLLRQAQAGDWRGLADRVAGELPAQLASTTSAA